MPPTNAITSFVSSGLCLKYKNRPNTSSTSNTFADAKLCTDKSTPIPTQRWRCEGSPPFVKSKNNSAALTHTNNPAASNAPTSSRSPSNACADSASSVSFTHPPPLAVVGLQRPQLL